jgi:hypothetical protein
MIYGYEQDDKHKESLPNDEEQPMDDGDNPVTAHHSFII